MNAIVTTATMNVITLWVTASAVSERPRTLEASPPWTASRTRSSISYRSTSSPSGPRPSETSFT